MKLLKITLVMGGIMCVDAAFAAEGTIVAATVNACLALEAANSCNNWTNQASIASNGQSTQTPPPPGSANAAANASSDSTDDASGDDESGSY